jgi:hypothetical protein
MAKRTRQPQVTYPTDVVFAAASYADRMNKGEYVKYKGGDPETNQIIYTNRELMDRALADQNLLNQVDRDAGEQVRRYYHSLTFKILKGIRLSEFDNTAMLIANKEQTAGNYDIAVAASLPSCHRRAMARDQANAKVAFATGGFIGTVGDKVSLTCEVVKANYSQQWGVFFITAITSQDQPIFFSYKRLLRFNSIST